MFAYTFIKITVFRYFLVFYLLWFIHKLVFFIVTFKSFKIIFHLIILTFKLVTFTTYLLYPSVRFLYINQLRKQNRYVVKLIWINLILRSFFIFKFWWLVYGVFIINRNIIRFIIFKIRNVSDLHYFIFWQKTKRIERIIWNRLVYISGMVK